MKAFPLANILFIVVDDLAWKDVGFHDSDIKTPNIDNLAAGQFPPVNAFWSVTMYDGKSQLLIKNPINRYLINSPMVPNMKKNEDGSLTLNIQKGSPGADKEANWLPAPNNTIYLVMRLYWPKEKSPSIINGTWKIPAVKLAK